jgi:ABC-type cobalamin/Fe3+-siderophores transport system ATPase subunit
MNSTFTKGSVWRKWDLHVHTKGTKKNDQFQSKTFNEFCVTLFRKALENGIVAIGITDYFNINNYKKVKEFISKIDSCTDFTDEEKKKIKHIFILPNVELRMLPVTDSGRLVNIHCLFNPDYESSLENNFFGSIEYSAGLGKKYKMNRQGLIDLGKSLDSSLNNETAYQKGIDSFVVTHSDLQKLLDENSDFRENVIVVVSNSNKDGASAFQKHYNLFEDIGVGSLDAVRKSIYSISDCIFSSNEEDIIYFLGLKKDNKKLVVEKCGSLKPCIHGSDAHTEEKLFEPDEQKYCWIKADPTFEGLKQIIYEPEIRIKIQQEDPRENEVYALIEKCVINFPSDLKIKIEEPEKKTDFCLQSKYEVEFSNNLTCIIGGRGTGKSTLVHLLYNACSKKDISKLEELNSPVLSLDLSPDPLRQSADLTTTEIPTNTEFFLQNEIEKFARDVHEMSNLIRLRLLLLSSLNNKISLKDLENEWTTASLVINELIEAYDTVSNITQKIESVNKRIEILKKQIAVIKSKEYQNFQKEIEDINTKIAEFRRYKNEYNDIVDKIDMLITTFSQLNWSKDQGKDTLDELSDLLGDYKEKLKQIFSPLNNTFKANNYSEKLREKKLQLKKYLEKKGLTEENIEELADASEQIKEMEDEIRTLERQKVPFDEIHKKRKSILDTYKEKYSAYQNRFFEVAKRLEEQLEGLPFFDKAISFTPKINEQRLREDIVTFVKESSPVKVTLRTDDIQSVLFDVADIVDYLESKEKIRNCVNQSTKTGLHKQILQELVNDPVFLEKLYLLLWKEYYDISNIQVQTKLGDKLLQNTSFGERCGIVISIILIAGTNPIVIDQPEDNLDGKFISNVLVPLIRKRKLCRQIILVTRDANIAIGGDAELIHILESDENKKKTRILPSSIENIEYRENYIWILDGGKEAFEKREKKYGFKTS